MINKYTIADNYLLFQTVCINNVSAFIIRNARFRNRYFDANYLMLHLLYRQAALFTWR